VSRHEFDLVVSLANARPHLYRTNESLIDPLFSLAENFCRRASKSHVEKLEEKLDDLVTLLKSTQQPRPIEEVPATIDTLPLLHQQL
jgi:hypothetical protein